MAVKIRLMRLGKKKQPFYRIVVVDSRFKRDGRYIENIGDYNPLLEGVSFKIDEEKVLKWLNFGAIPTDTVRSFLSKAGILEKFLQMKQQNRKKDMEVKE